MSKVFLLCIFVMIASGCKKIPTTAAVKSDKQKTTLFDRLIAKAPGGKIPYPFPKLISYLSQYGSPVSILIPVSRSAQGEHASFADPRRLVGFHKRSEDMPQDMLSLNATSIHARLFLGYVEGTKQIEVMSLSEGSTEFDFQLIENYGESDNAQAETAPQACFDCHQHRGPIFTVFPWLETSETNPIIGTLLKNIHGGDSIDGIPISPENRDVFEFDDLVEEAAAILLDNKLWSNQCVTRTDSAAVCRGNLLKNIFYSLELAPFTNFSLTTNFDHIDEFIPDRDVFDLPISAKQHLKNYSLAKNVSAILVKVINQKGYNYDTQKNSPLQLIYTWLRNLADSRDKDSVLTKDLMDLSADERRILFNEMANIAMYLHRKNLHPTPEHNPMTKRKSQFNLPSFSSKLGFSDKQIWLFSLKGDLKDLIIFYHRGVITQQTILPTNKEKSQFIENRQLGEPFYVSQENNSSRFDVSFLGRSYANNQTKDSVLLKQIFPDKPPEHMQVYFNPAGGKPDKTSKIYFNASYPEDSVELDLLCRTDTHSDIVYICTTFDPWQVEAAIDKMVADKTSSLHRRYLDPEVVVGEVINNLGYNLQLTKSIAD